MMEKEKLLRSGWTDGAEIEEIFADLIIHSHEFMHRKYNSAV